MTKVKIDFVHLHDHSCFSKRDAHSRIDLMVKRAKENGQKAIALTDHGVLHGIPELFREAKKHGIKPIAGMEGYLAPEGRATPSKHYHQILIAKNEKGWKNLLKLSSEAFMTGFYNKPRIDMELLEKHKEGLIVTSSCLAGWIPQLIMAGEVREARKVAQRFQAIFGDDFYFEIQPNTIPAQEMVNKELIKMSEELGIELLATADAHYVDKSDAKAHQAMLCLGRGKKMMTDDTPEYDGEETYYLQHGKEVYLNLKKQGIDPQVIIRAMNNTGKVADKINFDLVKEKDLLPEFPLPEGVDKDQLIGEMVKEGLMRKVNPVTKEYVDRIKFELGVIREKGYQDYFLIVSDAIKYAKSQGIEVGKGRGSGAGSLVAYLLDITEVDPIEHGLFFERFLDITRQKMPDIDTDIEDGRRYEVIDYLKRKYGKERVAQIANYGRMTAKQAFKNALMVYDVPFGKAQEITNLIPDELGMTIEKAYEMSPQLKAMKKKKVKRNDGKMVSLAEVFEVAEKFEFVVDKLGKHAGGVLITPTDITDHFPIFGSDDERVVQWDKDDIEQLGGVKFDFLGLKTLTMVGLAVRSIEKEYGIKIDTNEIVRNPNDPKVYELIASGNTQNLFQFNSSGMQQLCKAVKPTEFKHIVAINALYRPPALASGDTWRYARIKNGEEPEYYSHPEEKLITGETFGIITYQEHVMQLVHHFAGWDYGKGDKLRKMSAEQLEKLRPKFLADCEARGYDRESMDEIWSRIVRYMGYGFNKSHGVAYSMLTYLTAWLEVYYPEHWMSAMMSVKMGEQDKIAQVFAEIKKAGFEFQAPDINSSEYLFTASKGKIIFPLGTIKGVGDTAVEELMSKKPFTSLEDLMERCNLRVVSARAMKPLIFAGAFDSLYPELTRKEIFLKYLELKKESKKKRDEAQAMEWNDTVKAEFEKELLGVYITTHPMEKYHFRNWSEYPEGERNALVGGKVVKVKSFLDKNKNRMAFLTLETLEGVREVVVFHNTFKKYDELCKEGLMIMAEGKKDGEKLLANKLKELV
jgi:DNA polymerase III subunit alpha